MSGETVAGIARSRRILTGIAGGLVGRAVSLLAPFIVMPVLLRYLGHTDFGVWMTAMSITSMTMFVDLGIGNGLLTKLSSAYGRGDNEEMRGLISSAYASLTVIALLLLVLLFVILTAAKTGLLAAEGLGDSAGASIIAVCLAAFIAGIPASIIQKVFYSHQMVWLGNVWQAAAAAVSVVACLAAVKLGSGAWQAIAAYSVPPVVLMLVAAAVFFRRRPEIAPSVSSIDPAKIRMLLAIGSRFLVLGIVTSVALNADNVIIAQKLGAAAVTEYAIPAKLASVLGLMVTTLFLPLWPANGEAIARGDYAWVRASTLRMSLLGGLVVAIAGLCLVLLGKPIMMLWMGRNFSDQQMVLAFLCAMFSIMAFVSPFNMLLNSTGRVKVQIFPWAAFMLLTIAAKFLFLDQDRLWLVPMISCIAFAGIVLPSIYIACQAELNQGR